MSTGSVSSNHSAALEHTELGWKEGHILKGLKRLQMSNSKGTSSLPSVPHCKDCMTSNEGIYSLGVKIGQQGTAVKQVAPTSKPFKAETRISILDSDDADDESPKIQNSESSDQPAKELLSLDKLEVTQDFQVDPVKLSGNSGLFPSPVTDNFLFLEAPTVKPGVSPTDSLAHLEEMSTNSPEKHKGIKLSDRNNNQERSTDRKSRLDYVKRPQGQVSAKQVEGGTSDVVTSVQHTVPRALSCVNEARQRSSSMEVPLRRDQASQAGGDRQDYAISESPQRKPKPQLCDSARKAFILRSKSADGGPEQPKHTHSPLHQKLIKGQRPKVPSNPNPTGSKRTNPNKANGSTKNTLSKSEKDEDNSVSSSSKSLEKMQQCSPLVSPVKHSKIFKSTGVSEGSKSPTKSQITKLQSTNDSSEEGIYDNLPCSPRKQRRQDHHCDSELRSPSPPLPPGRTTSLFLRPSSDSFPKDQTSAGQAQSLKTGPTKMQPPQVSSVVQPQQSNTLKDSQHAAPQMAAEGKMYHTHSSLMHPVVIQESQASESVRLPADRAAMSYIENGAPSMLPNQSILQRSQQSISEPKLSEVLPPVYSNAYYQPQTSSSRAVKRTLPVNAKSHEAIAGQETNTFLIFGRQNKDDTDPCARSVQTFQTFTCEPHMIHECGVRDNARRRIETRCNSLDSEPSVQPVPSDSTMMLDWGFDEEGWLFKRSVSVSTRPPLKPVLGMNGAKARSQSFGARYMDRPSFNRSGKVRTQIKTHSGSSLNSLGDVLPGSMSCSSSYHCPMNRSLLNNFLIEEGLAVPLHLGSSSERLQSLKLQREQARRLQIEQQFSSAFGEPVSEEPERQSTITTIEEKVMLGIEENLHKSQEQERTSEVKQKSGSSLASWFGFRKSKLPAPSKKADPPKGKDDKREQKITSLLGGKQMKSDKKRDRRKSDGKEW